MQHKQQQDIKLCCQCQSRILVEDAGGIWWEERLGWLFLYLHQISCFCNPHLIVTLGRFGLREHTVLSPWCFWKHQSEYLRATCPTHHVGSRLAHNLLLGYWLFWWKYHHGLSCSSHWGTRESHKWRPLVTVCCSDPQKKLCWGGLLWTFVNSPKCLPF